MPPVQERVAQRAMSEMKELDSDARPSLASLEAAEHPASASDLLLSGLQIARTGDLNAAAEVIAQAILADPESADAYEALSIVLSALGKHDFAVKAKAKAVGLGRNAPADWETLGDMFAGLDQFEDAAQAFYTACQLSPQSVEIQQKLAEATSRCATTIKFRDIGGAPGAAIAAAEARSSNDRLLATNQIPPAWRVINLVTIEPAGNPHVAAFHELALSFENAFRSLGITVRVRKNTVGLEGINVLFGAHLIDSQEIADTIPQNTVVVNLEQFVGFNVAARPIYTSLMQRLAVWDYSARNIQQIGRVLSNPHICRVGIGYAPELTRHFPPLPQTTDVLFYGSLNPRRSRVLTELTQSGLKVRHLFGVYGRERDRAMAESKVVLNLHFYEDSIHEIVRTSYLLANSKAVVAECGAHTEIDDDIREALVAVPYDAIVQSCIALVNDEPRRHALEQRAFEIFSKRDQAKMLRDAIHATVLPIFG